MSKRYWVMLKDSAAEYGDKNGYEEKDMARSAAADIINDGFDEDEVLIIEGNEVDFTVVRESVRVDF